MKRTLKNSVDHLLFLGVLLLPTALMLTSVVLVVHFGIEPLVEKWL